MLSVSNLSYAVGAKQLLRDVSVTFAPGRLNLIIGPNGAGKSTLVKAVTGQIKPQSGTIQYAGVDINAISILQAARMRAVLSQNIELSFPLTVAEVVMMGRYPHFAGAPAAKDYEACNAAMSFFDVHDMAARDYVTLSGGEKQRVHFARVVAQVWFPVHQGCRYLILDEPLTFLDVRYQFDFLRKITELLRSPNLVVVGVVHDLNLAAKFADNITLINEGRILASGTRTQVLTPANISIAYQLMPVIHTSGDNMYLFFD